MRYGTCYKGSKNGIAEWVYMHFPKLTNFYDLFAGGCAITQIALMRRDLIGIELDEKYFNIAKKRIEGLLF